MEPWMRNATVIAIEIGAALFILILLYFIVSGILRAIARGAPAEGLKTGISGLRRTVRALFLLAGCVLSLGIGGINGLWWYEGKDLEAFTRNYVESIPEEFWIELAIGLGKVLALAIALSLVLRVVGRVLRWLCERCKAYEGIRANDESVQALFDTLRSIVRRSAWLGLLIVATDILGLPDSVQEHAWTLLRIYLIIASGLLIWRAVDAIIASIDALSKKYAHSHGLLRYYERLTHLIPLLRRCIEYAIYVVVGSLVVQQIESFASLAVWGPRLVRIIGTVFLARVIIEVSSVLLEEILITRSKLDRDQKKRRLTIVPLLRSILSYIIWFGAGVFIMKELAIDPTPILAGAGILALAVGLGAQNLINDTVSGFFILFENYYLVGDYIGAGDAEGVVEAIELRTTRIRDSAGRLHIIRNGQIENLINFSKSYTYAVVEVGVAYESDLDEVFAALNEIGEEIAKGNPDVLEPTEVQGLQAFGESELTMRTRTRVRPGKHLNVERAMRRAIKNAFDAKGIEIPYARRVLMLQDSDGNIVNPLGPDTTS